MKFDLLEHFRIAPPYSWWRSDDTIADLRARIYARRWTLYTQMWANLLLADFLYDQLSKQFDGQSNATFFFFLNRMLKLLFILLFIMYKFVVCPPISF